MHLDRKTKLATTARARRHRLLSCCLAAGLGSAIPGSFGEQSLLAFDVPPVANGNALHSGKAFDASSVSSDALKRVGIRFVDSARAATSQVSAKQPVSTQPVSSQPTSTQVSRLSPIQVSNGATQEAGVRIRIPSESRQGQPSSVADDVVATDTASSDVMKMTVGQSLTQSASSLKLQSPSTFSATQTAPKASVKTSVANTTKSSEPIAPGQFSPPSDSLAATRSMPVGTGFAPLPSTAPVSSTSVTTLAMPPQLLPPGVEPQSPPSLATTQVVRSENVPVNEERALAISMGAMHVKVNDSDSNGSKSGPTTFQTPIIASASPVPDRSSEQKQLSDSMLISRAPGVVKIPGMTVTANPKPSVEPIASALNESTSSPTLVQSESAPLNHISHSSSIAKVETTTIPSLAANSSETLSLPQVVPPPVSMQRVPSTVKMNGDVVAKDSPEQLPPVEANPRAPHRYEPSIVPVALASTVLKETEGVRETEGRAVDRDEAIVRNAIQGMSSQQFASATVNASTISVALRNVQVLTLQRTVNSVKIEDESICKVITTDPNSLIVIGAAIGECKIAIWTNDANARETEPQIHKVVVRETWGDATKNVVSIEDANQSIATMFPDSSVVIKSGVDGSLFVQGKASTNESAKQIIMLVRKMFLVPVQDRIAVAAL